MSPQLAGSIIEDGVVIPPVPVVELQPAPALVTLAPAPVPVLSQQAGDWGSDVLIPPGIVHPIVPGGTVGIPAVPVSELQPAASSVPGDITDELAQLEAQYSGYAPDLSDLPGFDLYDPFDAQFFGVANPALSHHAAWNAMLASCDLYGVESMAVAADCLHEGSGGTTGDGGWAYGPFQDHLTQFAGRPFYGKGPNNPAVNAWAWSANGIAYAIRQMAISVPSARGLHGHAAIYAIVYGYELPGDKPGAFRTRSAEYDHLHGMGSDWQSYVADRLNGPTVGATQAVPVPTYPNTTPYHSPDVHANWKDLIHLFSQYLPATKQTVEYVVPTIKDVLR